MREIITLEEIEDIIYDEIYQQYDGCGGKQEAAQRIYELIQQRYENTNQ